MEANAADRRAPAGDQRQCNEVGLLGLNLRTKTLRFPTVGADL